MLRTSLLLTLLFLAVPGPARGAGKVVVVSPEIRVEVEPGNEVFLSARPLPNEGFDAFVRRLTEDPTARKEILALNGPGVSRLRRPAMWNQGR